ncbi:MAG TPA: ATP-binding protein [Chloroflexota bacterium]
MPATLHRRQARLSVIRAVQVALGRQQSIDGLCRAVRQELSHALDTTTFVVGLFDDVSGMVEVVHQTEAGAELPGGSFPLGHGFMSEVIRNQQPSLIRHWSVEGPRVQVQYATDTPGLPESTITVPLLVGDRATGVLSLQSYDIETYDEDDLLLVQAVAAHVAPALEVLQRGGSVQATRRASELEAIMASMTEGLLVLDPAGRIISLNPQAREIFGPIGAGIVLGQRLDREQWGNWPLGAQTVAEALAPVLDDLILGEARRDLEVDVYGDGRRVLSFDSAPIRDTAGHLAGGEVVFRDITTRRDVERLKDELLSIASHDLRTPATVLKGQAQLMQRALRRGIVDRDELNERADMMVEHADRLGHMLNLLLDLSRVEAGRLDLVREPVDLVNIVQRVVSTVQSLTTKHTITADAPRSLIGVWDGARLYQVLQNLLTNAVKYSPDGGTISVSVGGDTTAATVSVRDPGLGIPPEDLPHLFERFYRVSGTRKLEGSGLGLYISHGIIAGHGGRLWAESAGPRNGSVFTFSLPY